MWTFAVFAAVSAFLISRAARARAQDVPKAKMVGTPIATVIALPYTVVITDAHRSFYWYLFKGKRRQSAFKEETFEHAWTFSTNALDVRVPDRDPITAEFPNNVQLHVSPENGTWLWVVVQNGQVLNSGTQSRRSDALFFGWNFVENTFRPRG